MLICKKPKIFDVDLYGIAAMLCICGIGWLLLIRPLEMKELRFLNDQQKNQKNKETAQLQLNQLESEVQGKQALTSRASQAENILKKSSDFPEVIRQIGLLAKNCRLRLDEITPGIPAYEVHYRKTGMSLQMYGSFPSLRKFLGSITKELPYVRIGAMDMAYKKTEKDLCNITMDLDIFAPK